MKKGVKIMVKDSLMTVPKDAIGPTLIEIAKKDGKVVVLSSDVSISCNVEMFHEKFQDRFFEMGIAEQSTMSVAGGFATEGFKPYYVALAIFSCGMTWAQTRQICNSNLNVKIIGTHAGVDDGQDGSGHHATEDIAISRALPRMVVLTPGDEVEVRAALYALSKYEGPAYMRVAREPQTIIHNTDYTFEIGKADIIFDEGKEFAIVYEGSAQEEAVKGYNLLKERGISGKLIAIRSIKPIDEDTLKDLAKNVKVIVTVENHSVVGGLYSAICEKVVNCNTGVKIKPIAFADEFMESGRAVDIKNKYGMSSEKIYECVMEEI